MLGVGVAKSSPLGESWSFRLAGSQPESGMAGLERFGDHGQHLGVKRIQVDLLSHPAAEPLECFGGVVLTAVEAVIDCALYAGSQRLEGGGDGEGGERDCKRAGLTGNGADHPDLVQAIAQDRDTH